MLQTTRLFIVATFLACTGLAHAALDKVEDTYELSLSQVQLPTFSTGNVVVRACPDCEPVLRPVSERTEYRLGSAGPQVTLRELRDAAKAARNGLVYVAFSTETGAVNRIILSLVD
jgi:hypothetical protein